MLLNKYSAHKSNPDRCLEEVLNEVMFKQGKKSAVRGVLQLQIISKARITELSKLSGTFAWGEKKKISKFKGKFLQWLLCSKTEILGLKCLNRHPSTVFTDIMNVDMFLITLYPTLCLWNKGDSKAHHDGCLDERS